MAGLGGGYATARARVRMCARDSLYRPPRVVGKILLRGGGKLG